MATLRAMTEAAYAAQKIGNLVIRDTAIASGYDVDSETDSQRYLDDYAAKAITAIKDWDGQTITAEDARNPDHPMVAARRCLTWMLSVGADKQAELIKAAAAAAIKR